MLNQHKVFSAGVHGDRLVHVLSGRYLATLATRNVDGSIHQAVVWFLESDGAILIATSAATRKAQNAARDTQRLFEAGRIGYLPVLDALRTSSQIEQSVAAAESRVASDQVNLFLALGGGWGDTNSAQSP